MPAKVLRDPLVQYTRGLNPAQIDMAILANLLFWQGAGQY